MCDTASFSAGHRIAIERKHCYYLDNEIKRVLVFAVELQIVRTTCISCDSEGGLGQVSKRHVRGRLKKALKNSILWNLHQDEAVRTYCDKDEA